MDTWPFELNLYFVLIQNGEFSSLAVDNIKLKSATIIRYPPRPPPFKSKFLTFFRHLRQNKKNVNLINCCLQLSTIVLNNSVGHCQFSLYLYLYFCIIKVSH